MSVSPSFADVHAPCLACGERLSYVCSGFANGYWLRAYFHCRRCWLTFWREETRDGGWSPLRLDGPPPEATGQPLPGPTVPSLRTSSGPPGPLRYP
ncbi:MAG: hypothetical protein KJ066_18510 [Acidobacteria bacterium]|nr:hypothetical protein [Acidobacteriota bacterium]